MQRIWNLKKQQKLGKRLDSQRRQNKKDIKIIASDINKGPLESAKKNINLYNFEDKIEIKLGSGIKTINKETDTIIISGLGGETIIDILKEDKQRLKNVKTIILSPHSSLYEVRKEVTSIMKDKIVKVYLAKAETKFSELFGE